MQARDIQKTRRASWGSAREQRRVSICGGDAPQRASSSSPWRRSYWRARTQGWTRQIIDGFCSYADDRNASGQMAAALGRKEMTTSVMQWGGRGGGGSGAVTNAVQAAASGSPTLPTRRSTAGCGSRSRERSVKGTSCPNDGGRHRDTNPSSPANLSPGWTHREVTKWGCKRDFAPH
jgi:hypothetical protein